jgi:predicted 2-oxoglutarate/Fe(II)-dependent dioxygenase YbiX
MIYNDNYDVKEGIVKKDLIDRIIESGETAEKKQLKIKQDVASLLQTPISYIASKEIYDILLPIIKHVNVTKKWNFDLAEFEPLQFTTFKEGEYIGWDRHQSAEPYSNGFIRKISFFITLEEPEEYDGGHFALMIPKHVPKKQRVLDFETKYLPGSLICFPSFIPFRTFPVLKNQKRILFGWVTGPQYR